MCELLTEDLCPPGSASLSLPDKILRFGSGWFAAMSLLVWAARLGDPVGHGRCEQPLRLPRSEEQSLLWVVSYRKWTVDACCIVAVELWMRCSAPR